VKEATSDRKSGGENRRRAGALFTARTLLVLMLGAVLLWQTAPATADDNATLSRLITDGWRAYEAGDLFGDQVGSAYAKFRRALKIDPDNDEARLGMSAIGEKTRERANLAVDAGNPEGAASHYRDALRAEPGHVATMGMLGIVQLELGQPDEAFTTFSEASALAPKNAGYLTGAGIAAYAIGDFDAAEESFRRSLAVAPEDATVHRLAGNNFERLEQWGEAAEAYKLALALAPVPKTDYFAVGRNFARAGKHASAAPYLERAAEYLPEEPLVFNHLAIVYHRLRRIPDAVAAAKTRDRLITPPATGTTPETPAIDRQGMAAFERGDYIDAAKTLPAAAAAGNAVAAYRLGRIYHHGLGVNIDLARALYWYSQAADGGDAGGQAGVGYMYYRGEGGVRKNPGRAATWFQKAAEGGVHGAMARLGYMYEHGEGVEQSSRLSTEWYFRAAKLGNRDARDHLRELGISPTSNVFTDVADAPQGFSELPALGFIAGATPAPERTAVDPVPDANESDEECAGIVGILDCL
jgi:TPR repeat protein